MDAEKYSIGYVHSLLIDLVYVPSSDFEKYSQWYAYHSRHQRIKIKPTDDFHMLIKLQQKKNRKIKTLIQFHQMKLT
jgi:hypothetical protein